MESPGEKLLTKIWETLTEQGLGGLLAPWQLKRTERARLEVRTEERLLLAQAERDAQDILAGRKRLDENKRLVVVKSRSPKLPAQAPTRPATEVVSEEAAWNPFAISDQEGSNKLFTDSVVKFSARQVKRRVNLHKIALFAEEQAEGATDSDVSDDPVDPDWLNRWRENAQDVSAEHMQRVWARILTEEVKSPGGFSMATLEFLRSLSKGDAEKIAAAGPFVCENGWIYRDQAELDKHKILFSDLLELQEIGILSGVEAIGLNMTKGSDHHNDYFQGIVCHDKALVITRDAKEPAVTVQIYRLTKLGREILSLGDYKASEEYVKFVGVKIKSQGFSVKYGDWVSTGLHSGVVTNQIEL